METLILAGVKEAIKSSSLCYCTDLGAVEDVEGDSYSTLITHSGVMKGLADVGKASEAFGHRVSYTLDALILAKDTHKHGPITINLANKKDIELTLLKAGYDWYAGSMNTIMKMAKHVDLCITDQLVMGQFRDIILTKAPQAIDGLLIGGNKHCLKSKISINVRTVKLNDEHIGYEFMAQINYKSEGLAVIPVQFVSYKTEVV